MLLTQGEAYTKGMMPKMKSEEGFALVEALVAMFIITVGALALLATFAGAALVNNRTSDRQKALAQATAQLDKLRSLPYADIGLAPESGVGLDPGRVHTDWIRYCPFDTDAACGDAGVTAYSTDCTIASHAEPHMVSANTTPAFTYVAANNDPRKAKLVARPPGTLTNPNTYLASGPIVYTYIYWPCDQETKRIKRDWKVATVVVRFRDPPSTMSTAAAEKFGVVRLSAILVDNPGLGQIPEQ